MFKLLRLKSSRILRNYKIKSKRIQRCSRCKQIGHNSKNKRCPSIVDLSDMVEDGEVEGTMGSDEESESEFNEEEDFVDIDDLLNSDEELF